MLFNQVITLVAVTETKNEYGDLKKKTTTKTVYADRQGVKRSEFYQAQTAGYKPEAVFIIRACEYSDEQQLTHNGTTYHIIRTYTADGELLELICSRGVR